MPFRRLVAFPLIWGTLFLALSALLLGTAAYGPFLRIEIELAKILATAGGFAAALAHDRGEHLRRAWFLLGGSTLFFLIRDLTLAPLGFESMGETPLLAVRAVLVILGNVVAVTGVYMLARTWSVAGLALPVRPRGQAAAVVAAALIAFALAGPGVFSFGRRLLAGDLGATAGAVSSLGDMVTLILIAPLLLTAVALRGGMFAWPWGLLTAGCMAWLSYDGFVALGPALGLGVDGTRTGAELCRGLACTFTCSAGLAQRWIALGGFRREPLE